MTARYLSSQGCQGMGRMLIFVSKLGYCAMLAISRWFRHAFAIVAFIGGGAIAAEGGDVAMITSLQGNASRATLQGPQAVHSFERLKHGDLLALERNARVQIVYFDNGRQETWQGGGRLEVTKVEGVAYGLPPAMVKMLPAVMVKQISRTPALDSQGRAGMMRLRSVATAEDVGKIENNYKRMRMEADRSDLSPELYLLSAMFEIRELERVEVALNELQAARPASPEVGLLVTLYQKALRNAREARGK